MQSGSYGQHSLDPAFRWTRSDKLVAIHCSGYREHIASFTKTHLAALLHSPLDISRLLAEPGPSERVQYIKHDPTLPSEIFPPPILTDTGPIVHMHLIIMVTSRSLHRVATLQDVKMPIFRISKSQ